MSDFVCLVNGIWLSSVPVYTQMQWSIAQCVMCVLVIFHIQCWQSFNKLCIFWKGNLNYSQSYIWECSSVNIRWMDGFRTTSITYMFSIQGNVRWCWRSFLWPLPILPSSYLVVSWNLWEVLQEDREWAAVLLQGHTRRFPQCTHTNIGLGPAHRATLPSVRAMWSLLMWAEWGYE